jgi:hypothetical protein
MFNDIPPLKSGRGIEQHRNSASIQTVHGRQYAVVDRPICDYEQAVQLRDWLNAALREGVPRDAARLHDYPRLLAFFDKYALGPKSKPSCLVCGRDDYDAPPAIQHLELPGIVVCLKCRDAAQEGTPT